MLYKELRKSGNAQKITPLTWFTVEFWKKGEKLQLYFEFKKKFRTLKIFAFLSNYSTQIKRN